jgi:ABC-type nitrate/sulfonate/bicarbonate transport system ATPase subunit
MSNLNLNLYENNFIQPIIEPETTNAPTNGADILIERLWKEQGFTAILVTHDVSEAVQLADRIILLDQGHIAQNFQVNLPRPRKKSIAFAQLEQLVLDAVLAT